MKACLGCARELTIRDVCVRCARKGWVQDDCGCAFDPDREQVLECEEHETARREDRPEAPHGTRMSTLLDK